MTRTRMTALVLTVLLYIIFAAIGVYGVYFVVSSVFGRQEATATPTTTHYVIEVIERDVLRCEMGATLQVSADADGVLVAWCFDTAR